jgi:hypothetical protein
MVIENYDLRYINPIPAEPTCDGETPSKQPNSMSLGRRVGACVAGAVMLVGGVELAGLANAHPSHVRPSAVCETPPPVAPQPALC